MTIPYASSEHNEWWTPENVLEAVRVLYGGPPDLDPASCAEANARVGALDYYSPEKGQDGLVLPWRGKVFTNPPYGYREGRQSNQAVWIERAFRGWARGEFDELVGVFAARPGTRWYRWTQHMCRCVLDERGSFVEPDARRIAREAAGKAYGGDTKGTVVVYMGWRWGAFYEAFGHLGEVLEPRRGR
jgi:hypothetical protein